MTAVPDARLDLAGAINYLIEHVAALEAEAEVKPVKMLNMSDAARELGFNAGYFQGRPWRIPHFGLKGYHHTISEWAKWFDRPEADRRAEWDRMSVRDRKLAQGVAS